MLICPYSKAQVTWDGGAGSNNWADPDNWDTNSLPTSTDDVVLGSSANVLIRGGESFPAKSVTLNASSLSIEVGGQLAITVGSTYAFTLNDGAFLNEGTLSITNCASAIRLMGTTSTFTNESSIDVDGHNGYGLLLSSGCTSCFVINNGSFNFDNGSNASNPAIFYQVSGNHFTNNGTLSIGSTSNAGIGIGLGAVASGGMTNNGTIDIINTGAGRAAISVGFLGGSFINNSTGILNIGAGVGGTWAGGFNMALTNDGTINIDKAGTVSVNAMGTGAYGGSKPFDNSNNVSPASSGLGCLNFNAGYTNTVSSPAPVTSIQLGGSSSCTSHDKINVTGTASIAGTLTITLANGFLPVAGESFTILEAGTRTGFYSATNYPTVPGIAWTTSYTGTSVIANAQSSLPVELVDFTAKSMGPQAVLLNWKTASEENNSGFDIQKSVDGAEWVKIGFEPGHGNSTEANHYQFTDFSPQKTSTVYYRLRQIDSDGRAEFSDVAAVNLPQNQSSAPPITPFPNPTNGVFRLLGELPTDALMTIYDSLGRPVMQGTATDAAQFDMGNFANGIYTLAMFHQGKISTCRLVKQD